LALLYAKLPFKNYNAAKEHQVELTMHQVEQALAWMQQPILQSMPPELQSISPEVWEELELLSLQVILERRLNSLH
jgi:hypothetical protein